MKDIPAIILTVFLVLSAQMANTQQLVTYRSESVSCVDGQYQTRETPVVPGSFKLFAAEGREISPKAWKIQPRDGIVVLADSICDLPLYCSYRIFYYQQPQISEYPWLQNPNTTDTTSGVSNKPMGYNPADLRNNAGSNEGKLRTRGSIARGVNAGNRQNAVLNSNLNLQVEGDLSDNLKVRASLTDRNIPIQPDGTNQKLQEFDKVFIEVYNNDFSMLAGDIQLKQNEDYFMRYAKKARGALLSGKLNTENIDIESDLGVSISRGNYHRQEITGQEGNQGPYKLRGANNESYIIVISGSERIYVDGELMIRGQSQDYIIDYNTGELTFTANRLITKDSRIIAEFEYRAASYNRMMLATNHDIKTKNSRYYIRYYNASDGKNQPLDQRLDMQQRSFLSSIGDDLSSALYPAWDSTGFEQSQVRYRITDTTVNGQVYDSVFVYSTNPDSAVYQVGFTEVGENMGNYMRLNSAANGRVFQWVAPKNGVPAGNYAPVTQLITPKKHQMLSLGAEHQVSDQTEVFYQMSFSDRDINTYSDRDGQNDQGIAFHGGVNQYLLKDSTHNLRLGVAYDFIQRNFSVLERFRESEFKRNWNVDNELAAVNEHAGEVSLNYTSASSLKAMMKSAVMHRPGEYTGARNFLDASYRTKAWDVFAYGDLLNTRQKEFTGYFLKNRVKLGKLFSKWQWYGRYQQEWQKGYFTGSDSLAGNSFRFHELETYLKQGRQAENQWKLGYLYRLDKLPSQQRLVGSSEAHKLGMDYRLMKTKSNRLDAGLQYRKLNILKDHSMDNTQAQDNFAGQLRYRHESFGGFLSGNLFYESGAGLELKKEYSYLKVPDGQGVYTWTDYNENGVEELDEFEEAVYQDQADYIRIYIPGDDYIKTYNNSLSLSLNLRPDRIINEQEGFAAVLSKLSNRFNMNLSDKNTAYNTGMRYLPVSYFIPDSSLMFFNNNLRNVLSWNRMGSVFTADLIYQRQDNRSQLVNGEEGRQAESWKLQWRWNVSRMVSISNTTGLDQQEYSSQFFDNKNYRIKGESNNLDVRVQPDVNMRVRAFFEFRHKKDDLSNEFSRSFSPGVEYRNNALINGMLSARFEYVRMTYSGETGTSLAWQMLESLQPGDNYRWTLSYQKRLSNGLQLNLNYQGRQPAGEQIIHTGGIQLRAYF